MKDFFHAARLLTWITQFGLSVAVPPAGCILLSVWLQDRFGLGGWVVLAGVVLGIAGAAGGLIASVRSMDRQAAQQQQPRCGTGHFFNRH